MLPPSPRARLYALGGYALAALFLAAYLSGFAHRLEVQHGVCAEHGESIHLEHASGPTAAAEGIALKDAADAAIDHGHEHCLLSFPRRELLPQTVCGAPPVHTAPIEILDAPDQAFVQGSLELLLLAPKSSPPA